MLLSDIELFELGVLAHIRLPGCGRSVRVLSGTACDAVPLTASLVQEGGRRLRVLVPWSLAMCVHCAFPFV